MFKRKNKNNEKSLKNALQSDYNFNYIFNKKEKNPNEIKEEDKIYKHKLKAFNNLKKSKENREIIFTCLINNILAKYNLISNINILLIIYFLFIIFPISLSKEIIIKKINFDSQITIFIKGVGDQYILSNFSGIISWQDCQFDGLPETVIINGYNQNEIKKIYHLDQDLNNVTMIFNPSINNLNAMFHSLSNITFIDLSKFDSPHIIDMKGMFQDCISLTSIDFTNFDTSSVTNMFNLFYNCQSLETLDLKSFITSNVFNMGFMFNGCSNLINLDLSNFNTQIVSYFAYIFNGCSSLLSLNLSNFVTTIATDISNMFNGCTNLTYINLENFVTTSVTNMNRMFLNCSSLTSLDLSNFNTRSLTNIEYIFSGCSSLKDLNIRNFVTTLVTDMSFAFNDCFLLTSLYLGNFNTSSVTNMYKMFNNCSSLISLNLENFDTSLVKHMDYMFYGCTKLKYLNIQNFKTDLVENMAYIFSYCESLISLNLNHFNTSSVKFMDQMFRNCLSLESLEINNFNTSLITNMNYMFANCNSLKFLNLDSFITSSVITMDCLFNNCSSLMSLNLTSFDTSNVKDIRHMFYNCSSLKNLDLHNFVTSSVELMNNMFDNCKSLLSLNINNFDTSKVTHIHNMFSGCSSLISLNLQNFQVPSNGSFLNMFSDCNQKLRICINESITSDNIKTQISNNFITNCSDECFIFNEIKLIVEKGKCIDICSNDDIYKYEYKDICYQTCPNCTHISSENDYLCEDDLVCVNNNKWNINKYINDLIGSNSYNNASIYYYDINSNKNDYNNLTFIEFPKETIDFLKNYFNLDENEEINVIVIDHLFHDINSFTNNYDYKLFLNNGTELNISFFKEDIYANIYLPIIDFILANFDYSIQFNKQGYDIYDKKSKFYNDICSPAYLGKNDITLIDRKKDIFPNNITLCKNNCEYKGVNIDEKRIICECNLNINNNYTKEEDDFLKEEDNGNFFTYLLDKINYKIFKCYKLLLIFDKIKKSYIFYAAIFIFSIIILNYFTFYKFVLSNVRKIMNKNFPSEERVLNDIKKELIKFKEMNSNIPYSTNNNRKNYKSKTDYKKKGLSSNIGNELISSNDSVFLRNSEIKESNNNNNESTNEEINELPFSQAMKKDRRNILIMFKSVIFQKIEFINLFYGNQKIKILLIYQYILSLLIDFFFNTFLYSDEVVSNKYHNNGQLDFIVSILLTLSSNIITSIICKFLNFDEDVEERLENILYIKREFNYLYAVQQFIKLLTIKVSLLFIIEIIFICFSFYYFAIFCIVYNNSQISLLINYIISLTESLITSIIISIIIAITRKIGIIYYNNKFYNVSKFLYNNF